MQSGMTRLSQWLRTAQALGIGLLVLQLGWGLEQLSPWRSAMLKEFDVLTRLTAPYAQRLPIVIVGIDDNSVPVIGQRWPWQRRLHAQLIDALTRRGAQLIAFDVMFDTPSNEEDDAALEAAIKRSGKVVLATAITRADGHYGSVWVKQDPLPRFVAAGAEVGAINIKLDEDQVLRRKPHEPDAMWQVLGRRISRETGLRFDPAGDYLRYLGHRQTFIYLSYYQALEPDKYLPKFDFQHALVLVGRTSFSTSDVSAIELDQLQTPFTLFDRTAMPGVEFHANLVETGFDDRPLHEVPASLRYILPVVLVLLMVIAGWRLHFRPMLLVLGTSWLVLPLGGYALFKHGDYWLPVAPALLGCTLTFLALGGLVLRRESAGRRAIRSMFSRYVPENVVHQLVHQRHGPELGGEQQLITLMFTDLAGFTDLAEELKPAEVGALLNEYFLRMTDEVFAHDGTLDKFIGDAIMAFWGAPLRDDDQARKAVLCARDMLSAMARFNAERKRQGKGALSMRIGLHTGMAIVGNLGSPKRFNYTAVGDAVNLAARLEGANKYYGTPVLYSEDTARLSGIAGHRRVDTVRVKGKRVAVTLFTLCDDTALIAATDAAHAAYASRIWGESLALWQGMAQRWPDDPVAQVFIARLEVFLINPPAIHWDGAWLLDSK